MLDEVVARVLPEGRAAPEDSVLRGEHALERAKKARMPVSERTRLSRPDEGFGTHDTVHVIRIGNVLEHARRERRVNLAAVAFQNPQVAEDGVDRHRAPCVETHERGAGTEEEWEGLCASGCVRGARALRCYEGRKPTVQIPPAWNARATRYEWTDMRRTSVASQSERAASSE